MLPPIDDYKGKVIYNILHRSSDFNISAFITRFGGFYDEKSKEEILKNLQLVKEGL